MTSALVEALDAALRAAEAPFGVIAVASSIVQKCPGVVDAVQQDELWASFVMNVVKRTPKFIDFDVVKSVYDAIFCGRPAAAHPPVAWSRAWAQCIPNATELMSENGFKSYEELFKWSVTDREAFWTAAIARVGVHFSAPPTAVLGAPDNVAAPQWLSGAQLNITDSCFQAPEHDISMVFARETAPEDLQYWTYGELRRRVNTIASALTATPCLSVGSAIAIDMPMDADSVAIYLGIVRAGMVAISIADSFSAPEIARRLRLGAAKGIFTVSSFIRAGKRMELGQRVHDARLLLEKEVGYSVPLVVVMSPDEPAVPDWMDAARGDLTFDDLTKRAAAGDADSFSAVVMPPDAHTNILFSSGTTGDPKAIPWTQLQPVKAAVDGHLHNDIRARDTVCWPTSLGWMMGPWLIYASLINRATIALFVGVPAGTAFGRFVHAARVTMLGVVPSMVANWHHTRCMEEHVPGGGLFASVRAFASTGECSNIHDYLYLMSLARFRAPVVEYCGGTEIGGAFLTCSLALDNSPTVFSTAALGSDVVVLSHDAETNEYTDTPANCEGALYLRPPSIGLSETLLNKDHHKTYYADVPRAGLRRHGDQVRVLAGGKYQLMGRCDDTMNLGGIKVSSAELERAVTTHTSVVEAAAIAHRSPTAGRDTLVMYVVLVAEAEAAATDVALLSKELQKLIRAELNPLFKISDVVVVDKLPKTPTNKVMRRSLRDAYAARVTSA